MRLLIKLLPLVLLFGMVVLPAEPAQAASGCTIRDDKHWKDKSVPVATLDPTDLLFRRTNLRWVTHMYYRWCKNGLRPDTVQYISMMFCGRKLTSQAVPYVRGIRYGMKGMDAFGMRMKRSNGWLPWQLLAGRYWYAKCDYYDFGNGPIMLRKHKPFYYIFSRVDIFGQGDRIIHGVNAVYVPGYSYDPRL